VEVGWNDDFRRAGDSRGPPQPFKQGEILYLLLTREFLRSGDRAAAGKRDLLVMRVELTAKPAREFEVVPITATCARPLTAIPAPFLELAGNAGRARPGDRTSIRVGRPPRRPQVPRCVRSFRAAPLAAQRQSTLDLFAQLTGLERKPAKEFLAAVRAVVSALETKG